jgi:trigger factor
VARTEDLEVTAEELGREIAKIAAALGRDPKEVAKTLDRSGQVVALAGDIIRSKALDVLVERANVLEEDALKTGDRSSEASSEPSEEDHPPSEDQRETS